MDKYLTKKGLITPEKTAEIRLKAKNATREALKNAATEVHPAIDYLFEEVYEKMHPALEE